MTNDEEKDPQRAFWLRRRHAILIELEAIEKLYLPDKFYERMAMRQLFDEEKRRRTQENKAAVVESH